ncbi:MAG: adenylate kinase family protein [Nitrososphaerota archaeon]|jgi:adenylate kinase|nr:adenylate kinase family protein [Nitrososphaerota archaeon]
MKRVILITGTPGIGKTTTATSLTEKLGATYINLTDYVKTHKLTLGKDKKRQTLIVNEKTLTNHLYESINNINTDIIIDGHYAAAITPPNVVTHVFVLRRNPIELKKQMQHKGFNKTKINENISAEILDNCLIEALQNHQNKVYELDITGQTTETIVNTIINALNNNKTYTPGSIDWISILEQEGLTDKYLLLS